MKKLFLVHILCLFIVLLNAQTIINPFVERSPSHNKITKIEFSKNSTRVTVSNSWNDNGLWVRFNPQTYLTNSENNSIKLKLLRVEGKEFNTKYTDVKEFVYVFPALDNDLKFISITESGIDGWEWKNISLKNESSEFLVLKSDAKMMEEDSPISRLLFIIPSGKNIKIFEKKESYYRVEYNGKIGYVNEVYFQLSGIKFQDSSFSNNNENKAPNNSYINDVNYIPASSKPSFESMLSGIKTAVLMSANPYTEKGQVKYLREMGFETIIANADNMNSIMDRYSYRKDVVFVAQLQAENDNYTFSFSFLPLAYEWKFTSRFTSNDFSKYNSNLSDAAYEIFRRAYGYKKPSYNKNSELHLAKRKTKWNKQQIVNDFKQNGTQPIEGIYENSTGVGQAKYNVAVKNMDGTLRLIYLSGANNPDDWDEGEVKATLIPSATQYLYKANWIMADKSENDNFYISFDQGVMNVINEKKEKDIYIKMYPSTSNNISSSPRTLTSGTGFAITSTGLIVTNNHVIEGASSINIRGVNGDFEKVLSAKIVMSDKNNDLAIIRIDDQSFFNVGTIPFAIKPSGSNVGENIFVLGYPLRATMGDEVKLTNGIISSKTGFQGDITSYQISAPVQPGNSGGPLFDSQGNLIGIINAKHTGAENASYAIKASYLSNLIDLLDDSPVLQKTSSVSGKPLTQQVSVLKKYVFIIEVNL